MLGIRFKTKKALREYIGKDITGHIIETSFFGLEYKSNLSGAAVCVSLNPERIRNAFAQIWVQDNILVKVK